MHVSELDPREEVFVLFHIGFRLYFSLYLKKNNLDIQGMKTLSIFKQNVLRLENLRFCYFLVLEARSANRTRS